MNDWLRNRLPIPLVALGTYIAMASISVLAGISAGLSAESRIDLLKELNPAYFNNTVASAEPEVRWILEPTLYHAETLMAATAGWVYNNQAVVHAHKPLISGFFQYVVPLTVVSMFGAAFYIVLSDLSEENPAAANLILRLVGWFR